jgi:hypothetical protein
MHLGLHPDTPDAEAQQALKNANRFFLTLYLDVRPDADAKANGLMQCERHSRAHRYHLYDIPSFHSLSSQRLRRASTRRHSVRKLCHVFFPFHFCKNLPQKITAIWPFTILAFAVYFLSPPSEDRLAANNMNEMLDIEDRLKDMLA